VIAAARGEWPRARTRKTAVTTWSGDRKHAPAMRSYPGMVLVVGLAACDAGATGTPDAVPVGAPGCETELELGAETLPLTGFLSVCVTDADTGEPAAGVAVTLDGGRAGVTDAAGRADFAGEWSRAITLGEPGESTITWTRFGGNRAILRFERDAAAARVRGDVPGWADLPAPAPGHYRIAEVRSSERPDPTYRKNRIPQEVVDGIAVNRCVRRAGDAAAPCAWTLATRPGLQRLIATIMDADDGGTPDDLDDDSYEIVGYGVGAELALAPREVRDGVALPLASDDALVVTAFELDAVDEAEGLAVAADLVLDLGDAGRFEWRSPPFAPGAPVLRPDGLGTYYLALQAFDPAEPASRSVNVHPFDPENEDTYQIIVRPRRLGVCAEACWTFSPRGLLVARFDRADGTSWIDVDASRDTQHLRPPPEVSLGPEPVTFEIVALDGYALSVHDIAPLLVVDEASAIARGSYAP
jgi:hypothetical protein